MGIEKELPVKEIIARTPNVKSVRLAPAEKADYRAGQFMKVTLDAETNLSRWLSFSSSPTEEGYIEFTKKLTGSDFSRAIERLRPGDRVKVSYPYGNFTLSGEDKKIAFLSGGIGITPIRSICKSIVDRRLGTDAILLYANHTAAEIAFADDFAAMERAHPALKVVHVLSAPEPGWPGRRGHIDEKTLKEEISDFTERKFYLCGPPVMVSAMKKLLDGLGLDGKRIVTENFAGY